MSDEFLDFNSSLITHHSPLNLWKKSEKMLLARVIGNVVSTQKNQRYEGSRIMLCRQITPDGEDMDYTCLALDSVSAGEGDIVLIVQEGFGASTASTGKAGAAIDSAIVGVVDYIDLLPNEKK
jgi:ethanolamine utilization protein EutN